MTYDNTGSRGGKLSKSSSQKLKLKQKRSSSAKRSNKPRIILTTTDDVKGDNGRRNIEEETDIRGYRDISNRSRSDAHLGEDKCLEELINAMKEQIKLETELETMRQDMALIVDFDIHNAFHYFDKDGKGYLNSIDIGNILQELSIAPLQDDILLFIRRYDPNLDCRITYFIYIYIHYIVYIGIKTFGRRLCPEQKSMPSY